MEARAKRTLVKSVPELWELADDMERMESWLSELMGGTVAIEVVAREPRHALAWRTPAGSNYGRIALELTEKGFGTAVRVTAQHERGDWVDSSIVLERLLDELGSPARRPFTRA